MDAFVSTEPGTVPLATRVDEVFADDGSLARALPSFEPRASQRAMAGAVARAIEDGGVLLVEAGTGTGKTLAYLVPAILSGRRVLVSTGTKNLQEQIFTKDLPLLARVLPVRFSATCMKGRGNYLCLHRFEQFREAPAFERPIDRVHFTLIEAWARTTDTGDRGEIDELPDDLPFWSRISATSENCLGSTCPQHAACYVTRMRQRAAESDVVIVNHHLLCADAAVRHREFGEVIPECSALVVDEAHQLEDVAAQYFGISVSTYRIDELVGDAERLLRRNAIAGREQADAIRSAAVRIHAAALSFFGVIGTPGALTGGDGGEPRAFPVSQGRRRGEGRAPGLFDERVRVTAEMLTPAAEPGLALIEALDAMTAAAALAREAPEDVRAIGRRAGEIRDELRFFMQADDPAFVYFVETRGTGTFLRALPIDVASIVRELLVGRMRTTVLTSATLAVGGSFAYVKGRLGIDESQDLVLPSEFDHRTQAILYLPARMPDPRQPEFTQRAADQVIEILQRTEGRAFVLFTSYAAMRAVHGRLATAVPYPLLVQGTAPRGVLLDQFRRTPNAVLLATASFWQGVDVAGDALSCVIIDKLPFASPADPIVAARMEAITSRGGDPFGEFQVPIAILTLLQGLGRLLRHREDRGVLAILDPRLQTMGYGRRFLAALPPAPITRNLDDILRFLGTDG
ncbi:MAG TPA: ATP-dependent DNA helicase [Vicinamibacterales bacterium]